MARDVSLNLLRERKTLLQSGRTILQAPRSV